jgi:hypothetical protein
MHYNERFCMTPLPPPKKNTITLNVFLRNHVNYFCTELKLFFADLNTAYCEVGLYTD